ncbi:hypothetical protein R6Q57_002817 [Mikania cordata]
MSDHQLPVRENPPIIVLNPDGSCTRFIPNPCTPPTTDQDLDPLVLTKDITINYINQTGVRIHIPKEILTSTRCPVEKLPLVVYYHGGGFILSTAATTITHELCNRLAAHVPAIVVNVDYRLAPENRLPAAYDDGVEALHWLKSTQDPWLANYANLSNCYLMGTSAGANLAYHAGLRVSQQRHDLEPLKIKGLILHSLFIGGLERVESEVRLADTGQQLTLSISDTIWDFCLPIGASREHEYCNPMAGCGLDDMGWVKDSGWQVMMVDRHGDLLIDRQMGFAKTLKLKGVECRCFYGDGDHGIEYYDESKAKELFEEVSSFISSIN